jgi:hypothetical protein
MCIEPGAVREIVDAREWLRAARRDETLAGSLRQAFDEAEAETQRRLPLTPALSPLRGAREKV